MDNARWYYVLGNAAAVASLIPVSLSAQRIRIFLTSRFLSSVKTESQYLELLLSPTWMESTSFFSSVLMPRMTDKGSKFSDYTIITH